MTEHKRLPVIALLGKAQAGKDTVGQMLLDARAPGVVAGTTAFAWKLKQIVGEMYNLDQHALYDDKGKESPTPFDCLRCPTCGKFEATEFTNDFQKLARCKLCGAVGDVNVFKSKWTPRTILQHIGTEGFRRIDPSVWVNYALRICQEQIDQGARFMVITDCRFRSEAQGVWARGGEVWRIKRPDGGGNLGIANHASETEQEGIKDSECQAVIDNDSTLDVLRGRVLTQYDRFQQKY